MKKTETRFPGVLIMVTTACALLYVACGSIYTTPSTRGRVQLSLCWFAVAQLFIGPLISYRWAIPYILKNGKRPIRNWKNADVHNVDLAREIAKAKGEVLWFVWAYYGTWAVGIACILAALFLARE